MLKSNLLKYLYGNNSRRQAERLTTCHGVNKTQQKALIRKLLQSGQKAADTCQCQAESYSQKVTSVEMYLKTEGKFLKNTEYIQNMMNFVSQANIATSDRYEDLYQLSS